MKRILVSLLVLIVANITIAQKQKDKDYTTWDENYREVRILEIFEFEEFYADSIESNDSIPPYYSKMEKYSFTASFSGAERPLDPKVEKSMKRVVEKYQGSSNQVNEWVEKEYEYIIEGETFWLPMRKELQEPFKKFIRRGDKLKLYCELMIEHTAENKLINTMMISEYKRLAK